MSQAQFDAFFEAVDTATDLAVFAVPNSEAEDEAMTEVVRLLGEARQKMLAVASGAVGLTRLR